MEGQGELIVQTPFEPSKENMKHHRHFIDPSLRSVAQGMSIAQVHHLMAMADEPSWLTPPMESILQHQGTNTRALCYHLLQCREDNTRTPQLNEVTIQRVIETVIKDSWLQLESDEDLKAVKDGTQSLKTVLDSKTAAERDIFLWNYAGVLIQTGEWRKFHSLEELYVLLASFWGMRAPKVIPTCTTWSTFYDEGSRIHLHNYRQHKHYLDSLRRSISPSRRGPRSETSAPRTPIQTPKPPPTLEDLVAISDPTWNPDLHKGLDYLWAIMQVPEREAFLRGLAAQQESTSMSAMVQIPPEETQQAAESTQPPPIQEEPEQPADSTAMEGPPEEPGDDPAVPSDQPDLEEVKKESDSVKQEDDQSDGDEAAADQVSQVATAGSVLGEAEPAADLQLAQVRRNRLARYTIGSIGLDSFVDIFNILSATASKYVDPEGTFVRKLSLSALPPYMRESLGDYDPVIVFVDSEIEEAIRTLAGDLSSLRRRYPSQNGIDWITFQYHMSLMQQDAPRGWHAPGFRMGGRIPLSVGNICQNHMAHDEFALCHTTPIRDWQRVRHMNTLGRDLATRENYVHDAVGALVHYNQLAMQANPQLEEMVMDDMMMIDHDDWITQVDTLSDAIRTGTGVAAIPDPRMEERERQAREAEADLIQTIEEENEERARRSQRRKEKKERRSHSTTQPPAPTVVILDYHPPHEPSTDGEEESVTRRLEFDRGSRAASVREPDTPEELHQQPHQPSSPRGTSPPLDLDDTGYDPGPQPLDVDAPEGVEEQVQQTDGDEQAEQEPEQPPPEGDQPAGEGEQNTGKGLGSAGQPPDPPEPPEDPDDPGPIPDEEEDEDDEEEEDQQEGQEGQEGEEGAQAEGAEEEKEEEDPPLQVVESESTKRSRKAKERKEKVDEAALTRLPYVLAEKGPLYKGTMIEVKDTPRRSKQWVPRKGAPTQVKDTTPINHVGNRSFENIRDQQISSIFTLQKHLADCSKGPRERHAAPDPLRSNTGEFSPCQTEMALVQSEDGGWCYEYSELPGLVPMNYGMKTFHIIEQVPFNTTPTGPHRNLVRQNIEELDIQVKSKKLNNKITHYIDELPPEVNPESIRAARVLIHDISNFQYNGIVDRGLEYYPSTLTSGGNVPVSDVDASGDWIHLASLVELIKGIKQRDINDLPFYLRGLIRMVPLKHMHQILLYAALTDLKTNIQIGVDSSAYMWVRAVQFHGITPLQHDKDWKPTLFHQDGLFYKDKPIITAMFSYAEVVEAFAQQDPAVYPQESVENFVFPLDRYPFAYTAPDVCPVGDQVLALRIKVQTAQQFGMIIFPSPNGLVITSGVPVRSVVGAVNNKGRHLDVQTLKYLEWKVADAPREQFPCTRGKCYLPSLEICHSYRLLTEHADGSPNITSLPAFDPSKHKDLRAPRAPDATGVNMDMLYCEFKGCTIMVYGKVTRPPIGTNRFPGWDAVARPARSYMEKGKGKGSGKSPGKGKGKGQKKGKGKGNRDETPSRDDKSKSDPKGPNVVPPTWKDKEYDDIPIVQDARPADYYVEAYLQGASDIPTFRVTWITSMGTMPRFTPVSPNRFGESKLWKTPEEEPEFWEPCKHEQGYAVLSPGEDDCCRMCPNTDADELIPCAWCSSWAHYRRKEDQETK